MKKLLPWIFTAFVFFAALHFFRNCNTYSDDSTEVSAFDKEEDIKSEIINQYSEKYKDFNLGTIEAFSESFDGYSGIIKFTYDDNGKKMVRVNNFRTDLKGKLTKIIYDTSSSYEDLEPGIVPEIK